MTKNLTQGKPLWLIVWFAMGSGLFETTARVAVSLLFIPAFGYIVACFASLVAWVAANCFLIPVCGYFVRRFQAGQNG